MLERQLNLKHGLFCTYRGLKPDMNMSEKCSKQRFLCTYGVLRSKNFLGGL